MKKMCMMAAGALVMAGLAVAGWQYRQYQQHAANSGANAETQNGTNSRQPAELTIDGHAIELPPALAASPSTETGIMPAAGTNDFQLPPAASQQPVRSETAPKLETVPHFSLPPPQ